MHKRGYTHILSLAPLPSCTAPFCTCRNTLGHSVTCINWVSAFRYLPPLSFLAVKYVRDFAHVFPHAFSKTSARSLLPFFASSFSTSFSSTPASGLRPSVTHMCVPHTWWHTRGYEHCVMFMAGGRRFETFWGLSFEVWILSWEWRLFCQWKGNRGEKWSDACFIKSFCWLAGSWTEAGILLESERPDNGDDENPSQVWMVAVQRWGQFRDRVRGHDRDTHLGSILVTKAAKIGVWAQTVCSCKYEKPAVSVKCSWDLCSLAS